MWFASLFVFPLLASSARAYALPSFRGSGWLLLVLFVLFLPKPFAALMIAVYGVFGWFFLATLLGFVCALFRDGDGCIFSRLVCCFSFDPLCARFCGLVAFFSFFFDCSGVSFSCVCNMV
ncbi:pectate lyase [Bacteroides graminisolvens]|uniref:pectate lyase n=1 Tax=Bacteroides graminisolvens TaxID=477666 RepID=UPI0037432855